MKKLLLSVLSLSALQGCVNRVGDFTVASTKNIDIKSEAHRVDTRRRVQGRDVIHIISFIPTGMYPSMKEAMDNAIEKAPGAVALSDVTVKRGVWYIPLIYGQDYFEI
ncbi:hypothetical protein [Azotobacter salinestris]|uniref:hypothetical protein n=1 Tax=Azotobacter salinestris TaxID=69964 RepID=UPI0032DE6E19